MTHWPKRRRAAVRSSSKYCTWEGTAETLIRGRRRGRLVVLETLERRTKRRLDEAIAHVRHRPTWMHLTGRVLAMHERPEIRFRKVIAGVVGARGHALGKLDPVQGQEKRRSG